MVIYECPKCLKKFLKKSNFSKHQNKKYNCINKVININEKSCEDKIDNISFQNIPINSNTQYIIPKLSNNDIEHNLFSDILDNNFENTIVNNSIDNLTNNSIEKNEKNEKNEDKNIFCCLYCMKNYSTQFNLNKHIKHNCKIKKEKDEERENIFKMLLKKDEQINILIEQNQTLIKEISNLKKINDKVIKQSKSKTNKSICSSSSTNISNSNNTTTNMTNTTNTTNTQNNNIVMFNFGKEDLGIIDNQIYMDRVVKKPITGVKIPEEILKLIHFNPAYPQLSNIYISDINREKCMVWDDGEWKLSPVDKIPEVIDKVVGYSNHMELKLREKFIDNKKVNDRLDVVNKYIKMNDSEYLDELKANIEDDNDDDNDNDNDVGGENKNIVKRCEGFQKLTYDTFKTTLYNEGKNIRKYQKNTKN